MAFNLGFKFANPAPNTGFPRLGKNKEETAVNSRR